MDTKTTFKNLGDPGKYRAFNLALTLGVLGFLANRYRKERTVWNLLPVVWGGILAVETAFKPGKTQE